MSIQRKKGESLGVVIWQLIIKTVEYSLHNILADHHIYVFHIYEEWQKPFNMWVFDADLPFNIHTRIEAAQWLEADMYGTALLLGKYSPRIACHFFMQVR